MFEVKLDAPGKIETLEANAFEELVDEEGHPTRAALDRVLGMFRERLRPS